MVEGFFRKFKDPEIPLRTKIVFGVLMTEGILGAAFIGSMFYGLATLNLHIGDVKRNAVAVDSTHYNLTCPSAHDNYVTWFADMGNDGAIDSIVRERRHTGELYGIWNDFPRSWAPSPNHKRFELNEYTGKLPNGFSLEVKKGG